MSIEVVRLDTAVAREKLTTVDLVDLVKLDVEGAELGTLKGASELLSWRTPLVIVFEYNYNVAQRAGWHLKEIMELLNSFHYSIYLIHGKGLKPFSTNLNAIIERDGSSKADFAAIPAGQRYDSMASIQG